MMHLLPSIVFDVAFATWTATSDEPFIILSSENGGAGNGQTVTATASANTTGSLRTATITITATGGAGTTPVTRTVMLSQEAVPTVRITSPTAAPSVPLSNHMSISINRFIFSVGGGAKGWTSNIIYRPAGADFITFSGGAMNPTQTGTVTKTINVSENTGGARTAEVVITTTGSKGTSASDRLTFTQPAAPATFNVEVTSPAGTTVMNDSILGTITGILAEGIMTNDSVQFVVTPSTAVVTFTRSHFISVDTSNSTVSGSARTFNVNFTVAANNTLADRTGELIFTVTSDTETRIVKVTFTQTATMLVLSDISDYASSADSQAGVEGLSATGDINGLGLEGVGITDLSFLMGITSLTGDDGDLVIRNTGLTSLAGLNNITSISGDLIIQNNNNLTSLEGLNALTNVGGHVVIRGNGALFSLAGLDVLGTITGDVTIQDNAMLSLCCGNVTLSDAIEDVRARNRSALGFGFYTSISENGSSACNFVNNLTFNLRADCLPLVASDFFRYSDEVTTKDANDTSSITLTFGDNAYDNLEVDPDEGGFTETLDATGWVATIAYPSWYYAVYYT